MAKPAFHSSIEGAQHSPKGLDGFLAMAQSAGASGAQPSNYMLEASEDGSQLKSAKEVKDAFEKYGLKLDGISAHCPFWVHTSACLLYTSPSPRDKRQSRMPSSA